MTSRGRRVAWVRVSGMNWSGETGKRPNRKERGGFIGAVCPCVLSSAASSLLRPGDPACAASRAGHPTSPPCSTTACALPAFLSHLQLLSALGEARCPVPPPNTLAFCLCSSSRAPQRWGSRPCLQTPIPLGTCSPSRAGAKEALTRPLGLQGRRSLRGLHRPSLL